MHFLDLATILCTGLMTGSELAVSLFVNPAIWKHDDHALARELAQRLGRIMPFWYGLGLVLLGAETWLRWRQSGAMLFLAATIVWFVTIPFSVAALVPVNNRIAASTAADSSWLAQHHQWDTLHRWRILLLLCAIICLLLGLHA